MNTKRPGLLKLQLIGLLRRWQREVELKKRYGAIAGQLERIGEVACRDADRFFRLRPRVARVDGAKDSANREQVSAGARHRSLPCIATRF